MPPRRRYPLSGGGITIVESNESEGEEEEYESEDPGEEEDTEEEEEHQTREYIDIVDSPRVSQNESEEEENQKRSQGVCSSSSGSQEDVEWKPGETEGLFCLICMEVWTSGGEHQVCCLPCGHLYGFSCIKKWLQQRRSAGKCPQCNRTCSLRDVRKIYASRVAAVDDEAQKRILFLETKLSSVEQKTASWSNKEAQWRNVEAELRLQVNKLKKKIANMESATMGAQRQCNVACQEQYIPGHKIYQEHHAQAPSCSFRHQGELLVNGGRIFDIDGSRQSLLLARRLSGVGGTFVLTQMSLHSGDLDDILLPPTVLPLEQLKIFTFPLTVTGLHSHHIYAGLQNGMVLVFDMRQTTGPFASLTGLTSNPVHTIHHLSTNSTPTSDVHPLLSASSIGLCQWNISGSEGRPSLVSETGNPGVCISSSYCPRSDHIVASYRPRVGASDDTAPTQLSSTQTRVSNSNSNGVDGSHVCLKRRGADSYYQKLSSKRAFVDTIRLPRTAIIDFGEEKKQLFASCDESTRELILQDPSTFIVSQRFPLSSHLPLQDVKYASLNGSGLLGLLSDDRFQLLRN
ncbi:hypothetical protein V5N11_021525 [Cardamine amara subsp. amara]|uniref:RING-type domain-containing protein n=1 Tax=Cardamine amara subsp. amara TaxID=228776 RepID=A0ABD0ZPT8_CARAN